MKIRFDDPLFEAWTQRFLYTMSEGGCEIVEITAPAGRTEQWQDQILAHVAPPRSGARSLLARLPWLGRPTTQRMC
jgi:hypothetical protein